MTATTLDMRYRTRALLDSLGARNRDQQTAVRRFRQVPLLELVGVKP